MPTLKVIKFKKRMKAKVKEEMSYFRNKKNDDIYQTSQIGKPSKKKTTKFHKLSKKGGGGHLQCKLLVGKKFATRGGSRG